MKRFTTSWMRVMLLGLVSLFAFQEAGAATVTYEGINYTTQGTKATVKRYTFKKGDTTFYKGDIVIPETFTLKNVTYTVVGTGANAFVDCRELTSLQLPATCVTIGRNCFKGCRFLISFLYIPPYVSCETPIFNIVKPALPAANTVKSYHTVFQK